MGPGPGPLDPKFLLQEVLFENVHSFGVSEYGHYTAQAQESLSDSGATNKAISFWEGRSLVTSMLLW